MTPLLRHYIKTLKGAFGALDGFRQRGTHSTHFNHKKAYVQNFGVGAVWGLYPVAGSPHYVVAQV